MIDSWKDRFIESLRDLRRREDRGALATLRRGLRQEVPYEAYRYLPADLKPWDEDAALLVASLFALHPGEGGSGNLGAAFGKIPERSDSTQRRFMALLNCHGEDLRNHLRQAVSLLKSKEVPIDWCQLLEDVLHWDHPDHYVQKNWAKRYWTKQKED